MFTQIFIKNLSTSIFLLTINTKIFFAGFLPDSGTIVSVESYNFTEYYIQHNSESDAVLIEDADTSASGKWKLVPGLADPNGVSFESVDFPGYYLRACF